LLASLGSPNLAGVYVCHCRAVTDRVIEDEVARGATSIEELTVRCGAGAECGGCWPALEELLAHHSLLHQSRELVDVHR
jgi:bacterioferritin-associated ferredoxin